MTRPSDVLPNLICITPALWVLPEMIQEVRGGAIIMTSGHVWYVSFDEARRIQQELDHARADHIPLL